MEPGRVAAGSLGPRLAGRLTAELILRSPQYMNCVKEYEIDLRGLFPTVDAACSCRSVTIIYPKSIEWKHACFRQRVASTDVETSLPDVETSLPAGSKINSIENLGATQVFTSQQEACQVILFVPQSPHPLIQAPDCAAPVQNQFDSIDLSDNNVIILEGFPKLPRLKTLILNNNRITRISKHLEGDSPLTTHTIRCTAQPIIASSSCLNL